MLEVAARYGVKRMMELATHHIALDEDPAAYETFRAEADRTIYAVINSTS